MTTASKKGHTKRRVLGAIAVLAVIGAAWFFDFPAIADDIPRPLTTASISSGTSFYVCSLGGFLDRSYSWRIDGPKSEIEEIISYLQLKPSATIPREFWRVPAFYWPRSLTGRMVPYRSINFADDSRGSDGSNYFLLHDTAKSRAYVLFKDNF
jgi:hypothetical protein